VIMGAAGEDTGALVMANGAGPGGGGGPGGSSLARTSSEVMAREILSDVDPWTAWMYKPQTMVVTLAGAGLLVYVASIPACDCSFCDYGASLVTLFFCGFFLMSFH
jgi:hypothetical protein